MELAAIEEDQIVRLGAVVYVNAFFFFGVVYVCTL